MLGEISISRTSSNQRDDYVTIEVMRADRQGRVKITLEIEAFGKALLGLATQPCDLEVRPPIKAPSA